MKQIARFETPAEFFDAPLSQSNDIGALLRNAGLHFDICTESVTISGVEGKLEFAPGIQASDVMKEALLRLGVNATFE